jgi:hypothetical protein
MASEHNDPEQLLEKEYELRLVVNRLRRDVYQQDDPFASNELLEEFDEAERNLREVEQKLAASLFQNPKSGLLLNTALESEDADSSGETPEKRLRNGGPPLPYDRVRVRGGPGVYRGIDTTGLAAKVYLRMAHVPTAIYHLFNPQQDPLISCEVRGASGGRRVCVTSYIEGYSAKAVDTFELLGDDEPHVFTQLPTLFPKRIRSINELTRATLNVMVQDLDGGVELHRTYPIWLLARTTAPLAVHDPKTGQWRDMALYFGAFVTPNAPSLMKFLRSATDCHPDGRLVGYQGSRNGVASQVKALFQALKDEARITYVNSVIDFSPVQGFASQRVRLPRESLENREANCIDGTVMFASLLEGISMNPAIVLVPGHAFVGWETWSNSGQWKYLETTMIGTDTFEAACDRGERMAKHYERKSMLRRLSLRDIRVKHGITPME